MEHMKLSLEGMKVKIKDKVIEKSNELKNTQSEADEYKVLGYIDALGDSISYINSLIKCIEKKQFK